MPQLKVRSFGKSDVGLKRSENQDAFVVNPELSLYLVADGMGGAASGDLASSIFAQAALEVFSALTVYSEQQLSDAVQQSFMLAHQRIQDHARKNPENQGMGCTAEVAAFSNDSCFVGHVGDSRTYLFREGRLKQLTRDHSLVQDQIDQGLITADAARKHPLRNIILRSVGANEDLVVDIIKGKTIPGDVFLICSDGLTDMLDDDSIKQILSSELSLSKRVQELIAEALAAGGYDNISVILCEIGTAP